MDKLLEERFWSKVHKAGPDDCWPWIANRIPQGYGSFSYGGEKRLATHVGWFLIHGVFPTQCVLHSCDNPPCCNPAHWFEGTKADNTQDMISKKRNFVPLGVLNGNSKLPIDTVQLVRRLFKAGRGSLTNSVRLAERFGVSKSTIRSAAKKETYK